jgi:hypothetical protein
MRGEPFSDKRVAVTGITKTPRGRGVEMPELRLNGRDLSGMALSIDRNLSGPSSLDCAPFDYAPFDRAPFDYAPFDCAPFDFAPFDFAQGGGASFGMTVVLGRAARDDQGRAHAVCAG